MAKLYPIAGQINPDRFRVVGGARLAGDVYISGAKNSVLKLMAVSLLAPGSSTIKNVPDIADVSMMAELLEQLGCKISRDFESKSITINVPETPGYRAEYESVRKLRASINVLGPLVARLGKAEVALPGGDAIGSRGLDFHTKGLISLGAEAHNEHGYIIASAANGLTGTKIELEFPSVGATENIMTLKGATHTAISDRIVTGTWAFAAVMTLGDISIHGARPEHLELPLEKLVSAGAVITSIADGIRVKMDRRPSAIDVATLPYPGFPTDLQPFVITLNAIAEGDSLVTENVFEGRFMFVNELLRLGAKIRVDGHHASITGIKELSSAPVVASDIRAGAGLVLAGLVSDGITFIEGGHHIDRGYPDFAQQLQGLGADVTRVD